LLASSGSGASPTALEATPSSLPDKVMAQLKQACPYRGLPDLATGDLRAESGVILDAAAGTGNRIGVQQVSSSIRAQSQQHPEDALKSQGRGAADLRGSEYTTSAMFW
jgi:hypothetical protein